MQCFIRMFGLREGGKVADYIYIYIPVQEFKLFC